MNEVETKQCDKCEGIKYHNKGIGKQSGNPYENWKCNKCGDTEWISSKPKTPKKWQNRSNIAPKGEDYQNIMNALRELYILVKAVALQNTTERDLNDTILKLKETK